MFKLSCISENSISPHLGNPYATKSALLSGLSVNDCKIITYSSSSGFFSGYPASREMIPGNVGTIPLKGGTIPLKGGMIPLSRRSIPVDRGTIPANRGMIPANHGMIPRNHRTIPVDRGTIVREGGIVFTKVKIEIAQAIIKCIPTKT